MMTIVVQVMTQVLTAKIEHFSLAAQDISPFPLGSYTGATAADMVKPICRYVIVGHWERRNYFHETTLHVMKHSSPQNVRQTVCLEEKDVGQRYVRIYHLHEQVEDCQY